jgi:hypothetical protein|tara:strand:- start:501 stop:1097 length:597 start_codon:yes stop_codon:yes gene_type:complete
MKNNDECLELKNIKYKTMLMNNIQPTKQPQITNIESFLEKEKNINKKQHWSKLSKLSKKNKLIAYCDMYSEKHKLTENEKQQLKTFLLKSLERKKLQRVKDVIYDTETQMIINIPTLVLNKQTSRYTLKNLDKKVSTLKSLAPRKLKNKKKDKVKKKRSKKEQGKNKEGLEMKNEDYREGEPLKKVRRKKKKETTVVS